MHPPGWLITLLETGSVGFSAANRMQLSDLLRLGIVSIKSAGMKRTVLVHDFSQLVQWCRAKYPEHSVKPDQLPFRGGNIVRGGDSKSGKQAHAVLPLQFKWFGSRQDRLTTLTWKYGIVSVLTDKLAELVLPEPWRLLTIENWEPFHQADYSDSPVSVMVVYLGGNASDVVINALKALHPSPHSALHFGDFDWEGLYIFQRLQNALPYTKLFVPDDIESLFVDFGSRKLIQKQKRRLAFDMKNSDCLPVIKLIESLNAGLEQEIVSLPKLLND